MLIGEYHHNLDEKNRIILPAKFRPFFSDEIVITRGLDHCLFVYSKTEWEKILSNLKSLSFTKEDTRSFMRIFLSGAIIQELDKQGRITISKELLKYAHLSHECVFLGVGDRIEIWDRSIWEEFYRSKEEHFEEISDHLFDSFLGE